MMKYVLVIGAGTNQVPIIQAAKDIGCFVYVVTPDGDYPGIKLADEWIEENIFNMDKIVEIFKTESKFIDAVISDQSDMVVPIVAYIAEKLDLPNWGYKNALYFTDKVLMRDIFEELEIPVPKNKKVISLEEVIEGAQNIGLPVVVKPTNSFSSKGVTLANNVKDLEDAYELAYNCSRTHEVIIEDYIEGKQFFSQGFVSNYKMNMYAFSDRYYYDLPNVFIPYTNAFPAKIDKRLEQRMVDMFNKVIDRLKPRFGHVWAEWILEEGSDDLYIVEIAIRGGGAHVTTDLIPRAYGVDTHQYLIREALGENTHFYNYHQFDHKAAAFYSFLLPEGEIVLIEGVETIEDIPGVVCADIKDIHVGNRTVSIADKNSRYGLIVIEGNSREDIDNTWKKLKEKIKIEVKTPCGNKSMIWE